MWNRQDFEEQMNEKNIKVRFWGRHGKAAADDLEQKLNFKFPSEVRAFIEEIGNVQFKGNSIILSGDDEGECNCITESNNIGLSEGVCILDNAGLSYILYRDGSIKAYEPHYIEPDGSVFSFNSFSDLIDWLTHET